MQGFGDVSGHFRSLINGHCDVVVVGVVFGDAVQAGRCAKRTVRAVTDVTEAKWNELTDVQKRRLIDCFRDVDGLEFGYSRFTRAHFRTLENQYLLYQDVCFPPDWDLALTGYAYGEILFEHGAHEAQRVRFEFDHVASMTQSKRVADHVTEFVPDAQVSIGRSHGTAGIQAADCFAGAVAEDHTGNSDWLSQLDGKRLTDCTAGSLIQLENDLCSYDR